MTLQRMEHVGIVVDDLEAAAAFFVELGLEPQERGRPRPGLRRSHPGRLDHSRDLAPTRRSPAAARLQAQARLSAIALSDPQLRAKRRTDCPQGTCATLSVAFERVRVVSGSPAAMIEFDLNGRKLALEETVVRELRERALAGAGSSSALNDLAVILARALSEQKPVTLRRAESRALERLLERST